MRREIQVGGLSVLLAVLLMAVAASLGAQATPIPVPVTATAGRWQVVNGRPESAGTIMLLDTATGNTWVLCGGADAGDQWCRMPKSDSPTASKQNP